MIESFPAGRHPLDSKGINKVEERSEIERRDNTRDAPLSLSLEIWSGSDSLLHHVSPLVIIENIKTRKTKTLWIVNRFQTCSSLTRVPTWDYWKSFKYDNRYDSLTVSNISKTRRFFVFSPKYFLCYFNSQALVSGFTMAIRRGHLCRKVGLTISAGLISYNKTREE